MLSSSEHIGQISGAGESNGLVEAGREEVWVAEVKVVEVAERVEGDGEGLRWLGGGVECFGGLFREPRMRREGRERGFGGGWRVGGGGGGGVGIVG